MAFQKVENVVTKSSFGMGFVKGPTMMLFKKILSNDITCNIGPYRIWRSNFWC